MRNLRATPWQRWQIRPVMPAKGRRLFMRIPIGKKEGEVISALRIIRAQLLCGKSYRKQV